MANKNNDMTAILTLINGDFCVASYRMDSPDSDSHLFAIVYKYDGYYEIRWQVAGSRKLYCEHIQEIVYKNNCFKTIGGVNRKLARMGFVL